MPTETKPSTSDNKEWAGVPADASLTYAALVNEPTKEEEKTLPIDKMDIEYYIQYTDYLFAMIDQYKLDLTLGFIEKDIYDQRMAEFAELLKQLKADFNIFQGYYYFDAQLTLDNYVDLFNNPDFVLNK